MNDLKNNVEAKLKTALTENNFTEAEELILFGFGVGLIGYEFEAATMLYTSKGCYTKRELGIQNKKRAIQILSSLDSYTDEILFTLGEYMLGDEDGSGFHPDPQAAAKLLTSKGDPKGYIIMGEHFLAAGDKEKAMDHFKAAYRLSSGSLGADKISLLDPSFDPNNDEGKLDFLLGDLSDEEKYPVLKEALWRVSSEGYCRLMKESIESGYPDSEALLWQKLLPYKEEIKRLKEKYENL